MSKQMEALLNEPSNTATMAAAWELIDKILNEQQRISVSKDDPCPRELKGHTTAYRALEAFALKGKEQSEK